MSKSLKNFIKIKEFTKTYSAKQLRFLFLLQKWNKIMNFDPKTSMDEAIEKERQFREFFQQAKAITRNFDIKKNPQKWSEKDRELSDKLRETKEKVHHHLCDNIDTASVLHQLSSLIVETNSYMKDSHNKIKSPLIMSISQYILRILKVLGVAEVNIFEYSVSGEEEKTEDVVAPYIQAIVDFRDQVKQLAGKDKKELISECDKIRDEVLASLGVRVEDTGMKTPSVWIKEDAETLMKSIQEKKEAKEREKREKEERKALEEKKKSTPPNEYYKTFENSIYTKFDENGVPTHTYSSFKEDGTPAEDASEKELSKEIINGLKKKMKALEKSYKKYLTKKEAEDKKNQETG
jgi:cysteinyl-tRNA synthetase